MFTKRIIPCLDVKNGRVVKGVNFVDLKDAGDPVEIAKAYDKAGADELVFLDITASSDDRSTVVDMVHKFWRSKAIMEDTKQVVSLTKIICRYYEDIPDGDRKSTRLNSSHRT